ncbi:MAG: ferritin family protein [Desulfobacterales bacterium]|nr:ferritin family protein [Desulfobacterales bacterium]
MFTFSDILDIAVKIEENGEAYYRRALKSVSDPDLVRMFQWLAEEEAAHADRFADMRTRIDDASKEDSQLAGIGRALLRDAVSEKGFSLDDTEAADISRVKTLIDLSVTFEQDTVDFYNLLRPFVADAQDRQLLDEIIAQENEHIKRLQSFLASGVPDFNAQ